MLFGTKFNLRLKILKLEVEKRDSLGKQHLKTIRRDNGIPGVYYSFDSNASISFTMSSSVFTDAVKSSANLFSISVGGKERTVVFKSVQYHPVASPGPHDSDYLFNQFVNLMKIEN